MSIDTEMAVHQLFSSIDTLKDADVLDLFNNRGDLRAAYEELGDLLKNWGRKALEAAE